MPTHDRLARRRPFSAGALAERSSLSSSVWSPIATSQPAVRAVERRLDRFIAGLPMKPPTKRLTGLVVELLRRRDLLELALAHHGDAVAHRHRLDLVVRDVDRRRPEPALEPRDLGAHLHAQLRVEVRERLVHQERLRLAHDRAAHRDALALTARERARLPVEERLEVEDARGVLDTRRSISSFGVLRSLRPKAMLS